MILAPNTTLNLGNYLVVLCTITWLVFILSGCRKENEETYFKTTSTDSIASDTIFVTYSKQIKPVFDEKCISCHVGGSSGNCDLDTYDHTITYIYSHQPRTKLYDYVKDVQNPHEGIVMDSLELKQISKWILNPAP